MGGRVTYAATKYPVYEELLKICRYSHYLRFKLKNEVSSVSILPFASMGSIKLSWASKHAVG